MDHLGTTSALTTLSPIIPDRIRELNNRLRMVRYTPGLGRPLLQLGFIHYARWTVLSWLPPASASGGWHGLRSKYLLFESNYDGLEGEYVRTFADILPVRLEKLWGACFGFDTEVERGPRGHVLVPGRFRSFVAKNKLHVLDFYAAYPEASVTDVRQAIAIEDLMASAANDLIGEDSELSRVDEVGSMSLGPVPASQTLRERVEALYSPWRRAVLGRYEVNPLTVVTPIADDDLRVLSESCAHDGLLAPLAETDTHFARISVIPRSMKDLGQPNPDWLDTAYLVFSSDAWGHPHDHLESLRMTIGDALGQMWGGCAGYPGHGDKVRARFHAWVNSRTVPTRYYVAGYPPRRVCEIRRYLDQRDALSCAYATDPRPSATRLLAALDDEP
jgi:hypothetical protein